MFRKENSSCSTIKNNNSDNPKQNAKPSKKGGNKNKKGGDSSPATTTTSALDVPLRKSDIRHLRERTKDFFSCSSDEDGGTVAENDEGAKQQQQQQRDERVASILDKVFLPGTISTRQLHHPELGKVTFYVRTPSPELPATAAAAAAASDADTITTEFFWPYGAPQVIWISQPPMPGIKQVEVAMPTVALLAVLPPEVMPTVYVPSPASQFLCRGAHLMRAGMMNLPAVFHASSSNSSSSSTTETPKNATHASLLATHTYIPRVVAIAVYGNPQPMAVGVMDAGVQSAVDVGAGTKGVGASIWTCYGDDLWLQQTLKLEKLLAMMDLLVPAIVSPIGGGNFNDGHYGNVGFIEGQRVSPTVAGSGADSDDEDEEDDDGDGDGDGDGEQAETAWATKNEPAEAKDGEESTLTTDADHGVKKTQSDDTTPFATVDDSSSGDKEQQQQPESPPSNEEAAEEEETVSQEDLLHQAFCQACLVSLNPKDLPMTVANFYANHVLPNRPPGSTIQLKQTRYKKFGNYLKEQVEQKIIVLGPGPDKSSQDKTGYIMALDKRHPVLLEYKQDHSEQVQEAKDTKTAAAASANHKLILVNLHVVPHHYIGPLRLDPEEVKGVNASSTERAGTGMLTLPEVRKLLEDYLERENLTDYDECQLDGPLFDVLYKKKKSTSGAIIDNNTLTVSRKEIADQWISLMDAAYAIVQMPGSKVIKLGRGKPPKVQIEVSMRQSRKFITKVRGMESYGVNGPALAKDIGRRLATQATVETESEKGAALTKGCVEIVLGGNFADEVEALLLGDERLCPGHGGVKNSYYKLPKNSVDVVLRKGVPARKRTKNRK